MHLCCLIGYNKLRLFTTKGWSVQLIPFYQILITFFFSFLSLDLRSVLCPLVGLVPTGSGFGKHLILGLCSCISGSSQFQHNKFVTAGGNQLRIWLKDTKTKTAESQTLFDFARQILHTQAETFNRPMEPSTSNGFRSSTYWNKPPSRGRNKPSRSLSPASRAFTDNDLKRPISPLPLLSGNVAPTVSRVLSLNLSISHGVSHTPKRDISSHTHTKQMHEEFDVKDEKAMVKLMKSTLPSFSNEHDWEMAAFELTLVLDRVWSHKQALNITDYLKTTQFDILCSYVRC